MKTLFVAVACWCLLAVVAGRSRSSLSLSRESSLLRESILSRESSLPRESILSRESSGPEPKIMAIYEEEPIQLSREESKKLNIPSEFNICSVKAYRTFRQVRVGETLGRQKFNGVCIECGKCTKEGMKCSEVKPLAKYDNTRMIGKISFKRLHGHLRNELAVGRC